MKQKRQVDKRQAYSVESSIHTRCLCLKIQYLFKTWQIINYSRFSMTLHTKWIYLMQIVTKDVT